MTYAFNPWNYLSFGFNLGGDFDKREGNSEHNLLLDMGLIYKFINNQIFGMHSVGISVQNALSPSVHAKTWHKQPVNTKLSYWTELLGRRVQAGFDFYVMDCMDDNPYLTYSSYLGLERYPFNVYVLYGKEFLGGSVGYRVATKNNNGIILSFQYVNFIENKKSSMSLKCDVNLGKSREEKYSRRMGRGTGCNFSVYMYIKAIELYENNNYFDALALFSEIETDYSDFVRNDWCCYFIGDCYAKMGMVRLAERQLINANNKFPNSTSNTFNNLTLLKIAVEEKNNEKISKYTELIQKSEMKSDSLKQESNFLNAEHYFMVNDYTNALCFYLQISPGHPRYIAAQYSIAIIYSNITMNSEVLYCLDGTKNERLNDSLKQAVLYKKVQDDLSSEVAEIKSAYDSLGDSLDKTLRQRQSGFILKTIDSLHVIQENYFKTIERYRLINSPLLKKWLILGNKLLCYLNEEELSTIEKCLSIINEYK